MPAIDWSPICKLIHENQRFTISSHVRPDGDAAGSEIALAEILRSLGKAVTIVNPSRLPQSLGFLNPDNSVYKIREGVSVEEAADCDVYFIVDTSARAQLPEVIKAIESTTGHVVVIDHHVSSDNLSATEIRDTTASATGELIFELGEELAAELSAFAATCLYVAIATDTGWFRFPATSQRTMRIGGELIRLGAKPHELYRLLYEQRSIARMHLTGRVLKRMRADCGGRLVWACADRRDFRDASAVQADTEGIVNECLSVATADAAFLAVEQPNGDVKFSLRSRGDIDVATLAEQFGGGGHRQAAGATLSGPFRMALGKVLKAFRNLMHDDSESIELDTEFGLELDIEPSSDDDTVSPDPPTG